MFLCEKYKLLAASLFLNVSQPPYMTQYASAGAKSEINKTVVKITREFSSLQSRTLLQLCSLGYVMVRGRCLVFIEYFSNKQDTLIVDIFPSKTQFLFHRSS